MQPGDHLADEILSAAIDDQLTLEEARQANAHLETCSLCRARRDELGSVVELLRELPSLEPPRDFSIGLRLVADPPNVIRLRRWYGVARTGAASLAAVFVFLTVGALYVDSQPRASTVALSSQAQGKSGPALGVPAAPAIESAPAPQDGTTAQSSARAQSGQAAQNPTVPTPPAIRAAAPAVPASAAAPAGAAVPAKGVSSPGAPAAGAAPGGAVAARSQPQATGPEVADQVTAATSVRPLPTPSPTPIALPRQVTQVAPQAAPPPFASPPVDSAAPLRTAAASVGVLAVVGLLVTLVIRRRLRAAITSPTESMH